MSDFMVPDMIEPVVGWRVWRVNTGGLNSLNHELSWPFRERAEARCRHSEPSTQNVVGWQVVSPSGEATWVRDALEGERLEAPYYPTHPVYGLTGPTGVTYHPVATSYSSASMVISTLPVDPTEPFELPTAPSDLVVPRGWEWAIGYRQVQYPPVHTACPGEDCLCGIYALKQKDMNSNYMAGAHVWGEVYLSGKLIEGEFGYRAQYAYPKNLSSAWSFPQLEEYGVPFERRPITQIAIQKALPTGPGRRGIRIGISVNLIAFAFNLLLAALTGVSVVTIVCLFINMISILALMIISAWMSR